MFWVALFLVIFVSYLIGSIPFSYLAGKIFQGIDLREYGSGNLGASNALRVLGKKLGIAVLLMDVLKGVVCVIVAGLFSQKLAFSDFCVLFKVSAGISVILGHVFTIYLGFKGGKGVATALGVFLSLSFVPVFIVICIWGAVVWYSRYISLGSIVAACILPLFFYFHEYLFGVALHPLIFNFSLVIAFLILAKHRTNISRIIDGTENRIGESCKT